MNRMKNYLLVLASVALLALPTARVEADSFQPMSVTPGGAAVNGLSLSIRLENAVVEKGQTTLMTIIVRNSGGAVRNLN
jgi:hypothetical protein